MSEQQPFFPDQNTNGKSQMGVTLEKAIPLNIDPNEIMQSSLEQLQINQNISQIPHSQKNELIFQTQQSILQSQMPLQSSHFSGQHFYQSQPLDCNELQQMNMEMNKNAQINQIAHQFQNFSLNGIHQENPLQMEQHNQLYHKNSNVDLQSFQMNSQFV